MKTNNTAAVNCIQTQSALSRETFWQTRNRGTNCSEYQIYLDCADDGRGGDITNDNKPLKTYQEWLRS